jgi:hypothetical protein
MNILIQDHESGAYLYGHTVLEQIKRTGQSQRLKTYKVPGEAFIAFLSLRYPNVAEVKAYLAAVQETDSINPQSGALLRAVDEVIDIDPQEWEAALRSAGLERGEDSDSADWWKGK